MPTQTWATMASLGLELVATAAFALSGIVAAARKNMDVVGVCVVGFLASFGGGTLRDLLIDRRPFFWVEYQSVLIGVLALCVGAVTFLRRRHMDLTEKAIQWPDAIGLGLFCATGVHQAYIHGMPGLVVIMMGVVTGAFGGVLRDMVCNEIPALLKDHRPYALCAFAGGCAYLALQLSGADSLSCILACIVLTTGLRSLALLRDWRLPSWQE